MNWSRDILALVVLILVCLGIADYWGKHKASALPQVEVYSGVEDEESKHTVVIHGLIHCDVYENDPNTLICHIKNIKEVEVVPTEEAQQEADKTSI